MSEYVKDLLAEVKAKHPAQPEFHQAVQEVAESLSLVLDRHPEYRSAKILERIIEPERVLIFRVPWCDLDQPGRGFPLLAGRRLDARHFKYGVIFPEDYQNTPGKIRTNFT